MANTRFNYDICRTIKKNQESTGPGRYILDVPGWGLKPCYVADPQIIPQKWGANLMTNSINLESELLGLNQILGRHNLYETKKQPIYTEQIEYPTCYGLTTEQSRAILPAWLFRDLPQNDFYYLPLNPQENTCFPFHNNLSTRILEKDYFVEKINCNVKLENNNGILYTQQYNNNYPKSQINLIN